MTAIPLTTEAEHQDECGDLDRTFKEAGGVVVCQRCRQGVVQ